MTDRDDPSIPTLTIRAAASHEPPVLTEVADQEERDPTFRHGQHTRPPTDQSPPPWDVAPQQPAWTAPAPNAPATAAPATSSGTSEPGTPRRTGVGGSSSAPSEAVLRAALQADIEDAVQDALEEALHQVKARLEAELPDIVARAVRRTRLG